MHTIRLRRQWARRAGVIGIAWAVGGALGSGRLAASPTWAACARIAAPAIDECSGIVESRRYPGVLWVHNDSGDRARFFAIDLRGNLLAEFQVDGAQNIDWEDIAVDDSGHVYLGDFGNNRNKRRDLVVYVVDEPDPRRAAGSPPVTVLRRLPFRYPDQTAFPDSAQFNFDCEAMFWRAGKLYLLTKHRSDLFTTLYRLDPRHPGEQVVEKLAEFEIGSPVTAADCSPDGKRLVVLSYQYLHLFEIPAGGDNLLAGRNHATLIEGRQCEGVCFDGSRVLYTNEQREIYCVSTRSLWTSARYIPDAPRLAVPQVEPHLDGSAGEWRAASRAGQLVFDRYVQPQAETDAVADPKTMRRAAAVARDSVRVRVGWCAQGVLVHASWRVQGWAAVTQAAAPLAYFMLGPAGTGRPCLEADQGLWSAVPAGDSLVVAPAAPEPGQPSCGVPVQALPQPGAVTRRRGDRLDFEVLLPVADPAALAPGGELLLDVVLLEIAAGQRIELGWSAALDMQPLGNPLLWGRLRLEPGRGGPGGR